MGRKKKSDRGRISGSEPLGAIIDIGSNTVRLVIYGGPARAPVVSPDGERIAFEIDAYAKERLLEGLDAIGATLKEEKAIGEFERHDCENRRWLYAPGEEERA